MGTHPSEISACYNQLLKSYRYIQAEGKNSKKVCANMLRGIHLIGLAVMAKQSIEDDIPIESFAGWVKTFFSGSNVISVDTKYNEASKAGFNKSENIHIRHEAMVKHYEERFLANL